MAETGAALRRYAARLSRTYFVALVLIAALVGSSHLILRDTAASHPTIVEEINALTTQRMMSQRIALLLSELAAQPGDPKLLADLDEISSRFSAAHQRLSSNEGNSAETTALYFAAPHNVDSQVSAVLALVDKVLAAGVASPPLDVLPVIKGRLLPGLDQLVKQRQGEAAARTSTALTVATALAVLTLIVLITEAFVIFRPLSRQLHASASELITAHDSLQNSVRQDSLTGLPNRRYLHEHLGVTLHSAARQSQVVGLCHFDLIGFRRLNERLGHDIGDRVLIHVASVIKTETRRGDFIARVGADEFIVVSPDAKDQEGLKWLGKRITSRIAQPLTLDGGLCRLSASAGIAFAPPGATAVRRLLADADLALRESKKCGEPTLCTPNLRSANENRLTLRDDLDRALDRSEIEPWFQPQICARTGAINGFEALARWIHPKKGLLSPATFIDAATEFGFGDRLAETILDKSLNALAAWRSEGLTAPCIGVNFAAEHLSDPFMVEKIKWAVEARSLAPEDVCIEILESVLVDDERTDTAQNLTALSRAGFRVDLDDFGTGHASIATLQRFPVDRIKIDRSFVTDIDTNADQQKVTGAMIDLAHSLGVKALAEGVETEGEWAKLTLLGCDHLQGFCIGRPMPSPEIQGWVTEWTRRLAATG